MSSLIDDAGFESWSAEVCEMLLLCQLVSKEDLPRYEAKLQELALPNTARKVGAWTCARVVLDDVGTFDVALYRKRMIIKSVSDRLLRKSLLDECIESALNFRDAATRAAHALMRTLTAEKDLQLRVYTVVRCSRLRKRALFSRAAKNPPIIGDGLTSFYTRIYDSDLGGIAVVRVSRHLTITYGIGGALSQDIVNLIYEDILYSSNGINAENVFNFYESMNKYILPLEINLFIQKLFYLLAFFAAAASVLTVLVTDMFSSVAIDGHEWHIEWSKVELGMIKAFTALFLFVLFWFAMNKLLRKGRLGV